MSRLQLLIINGAFLTVCAVFIHSSRELVLTGLLLFLPFLDRHHWKHSKLISSESSGAQDGKNNNSEKYFLKLLPHTILLIISVIIISLNTAYISIALSSLLLTALPEEWFFRAYFMKQLEIIIHLNKTRIKRIGPELAANIATSIFFALLHTITQGWFGLSVFIPSLIFGWVYQKNQDLLLVTLLHTLSNIVFYIYLSNLVN